MIYNRSTIVGLLQISHEQIYCQSLQATQEHSVVSLFFPSLPLLKVLDHLQWSADWTPLLLFTTELSQINPDIKHK